MECVRNIINPVTGLRRGDCQCEYCDDERRDFAVLEACELALAQAIGALLRAGMMPDEIAATVRQRAPKKSKAWMLTRIELTCVAGYWLSRPEWHAQLAQVDQLCKYTGFHVGTTIPGWMQRWYLDKAGCDAAAAATTVADVWIALAPELEALSVAPPPDVVARWRVEPIDRPSNVIDFPTGRRT